VSFRTAAEAVRRVVASACARTSGCVPGRAGVRVAIAVGALALAACAPALPPAGPPAPATPRPDVLLSDAAIDALADLLRVEDTRVYDAERVGRHARDSLPFVRSRAALAAGRVRDRAATPLLLSLLDDADADVRASAAFALGLLADSAAEVTAALAALAETPGGGRPAVEAIAALGRIGTPAAFAPIERIIAAAAAPGTAAAAPGAAARPHAERVAEALLAAWTFPRAAATADAIAQLAAAPDTALRWRATYTLMRWSDPRTEAVLRERLTDDDPLTRALAARALRAPFADSAGARAAAREALRHALDDAHTHVRINAVRALASFDEPDVVAPITRLLEDPDTNVVLAAVESLGAVGTDAAAALGGVAADAGARPAIRAAALRPLFSATPDAALELAIGMAAAPDPLARLYAARALAAATWDGAGDRLGQLARDEDPRVAAAAFAAIGALAPPATVRALATGGLTAPSPIARAGALRALQRHADAADLPILLEAYDAARNDAHNAAALAAVDGLGVLAGQGVPVARAFFVRFAPASDAAVRRRVVQRLGERDGWRDAAPPRLHAWYADAVRRLVAPVLAGEPAPRMAIEGPDGTILLELDPVAAPLTVASFLALAGRGYFDAGAGRAPRWHRVVPNFVLQDGDPRGDGSGPGYTIRDEINTLRYGRGALGMALSGPDTGGSQFFITHAPQPHLDGGYTVFGRVVDGMAAADRVVQDDPIHAIRVVRP
jgi:cyclophilin family peptidyl-prolyl cis-trans isomerase/HEAT repeat protein